MKRTVTLRTPLPLDEARSRLRTALERATDRSRPVGRVRDFTARLRWKGPVNNPFRSELALVFDPEENEAGGVVLYGVSDITVFGRFLLVALTCMLLGMAITARIQAGADSLLPWGLLIVGSFAVGLVYAVGREVARGEHDRLAGFVARALDARAVAGPTDSGRRRPKRGPDANRAAAAERRG